MKVNYGQTSWHELCQLAHSIRTGQCSDSEINAFRARVQKKLMEGLAKAIDAEIKRAEMVNEKCQGEVVLSFDMKIEPLSESPKYDLLADLDNILNKKETQEKIA